MKEIWKPIPGYENIYSVSNHGQIKRDIVSQGAKIKILKLSFHKTGYYRIGLRKNKKRKTFSVAFLVASAFIGPRPKGLHINHKDTCKTNNHRLNLEYVTRAENMHHASQNKLFHPKTGSDNGNSVLTKKEVLEIRKKYAKGNVFKRPLAREYGVCQKTITMIVDRITWKHI